MTPEELKGFVALLKEAGMSGPAYQGQRSSYRQMRTVKPYKPKKPKSQQQKIQGLAAKARRMSSKSMHMAKGAQQIPGGFGSLVQGAGNTQAQPNQAYQPRMNNALGDQNALLPALPQLGHGVPNQGSPGASYSGAPPTAMQSSGAKPGGSYKSAEAFKKAYLELVKAAQKKNVGWGDQLAEGLGKAWEATKPYLPELAGAGLAGGATYAFTEGDAQKALAAALMGGGAMHYAKDPLKQWLFPPPDVPNLKLDPYTAYTTKGTGLDPIKYGDPGRHYVTGPGGTHMIPLPSGWQEQAGEQGTPEHQGWLKNFYESRK